MKRLAIIILGGLALLGTTTSCQKDFEEINTNPNRPQQALPTALFNGSTKLFLKNTRNYTTSGMMFRSWMLRIPILRKAVSYTVTMQGITYGATLIK